MFDSAEIATFTPEERAKYHLDMTTERDIHNQIEYARVTGREEGREEGLAEGMEKGFRLMAEQLRKMGISEEEINRRIVEAKSKEYRVLSRGFQPGFS